MNTSKPSMTFNSNQISSTHSKDLQDLHPPSSSSHQPFPLPNKPTRSQLKHQSKTLESFLPSSNPIQISHFTHQISILDQESQNHPLHWSKGLPTLQLQSLQRACRSTFLFNLSLSLFSFQSYPSSDSKPILSLLLQSQ